MAKLKPIERLAGDVREGDLVRFKLAGSTTVDEYTGYYCGKQDCFFYFNSVPYQQTFGDSLDIEDVILITIRDEFKPVGYEIMRRAKKK